MIKGSQTTWSDLADLPAQPCGRDCRGGLVCRAHDRLQITLLPGHSVSRPTEAHSPCYDHTSDRRMDCSADHRGVSLGRSARVSRARPGRRLWRGCEATSTRAGHSGSTNRTALALAKWPCRAADRLGPTRVPRPCDRARRDAPSPDHVQVRRLLQPGAHAPGAREGRTGWPFYRAVWSDHCRADGRRPPSPLRSNSSYQYGQVSAKVDVSGPDQRATPSKAVCWNPVTRGAQTCELKNCRARKWVGELHTSTEGVHQLMRGATLSPSVGSGSRGSPLRAGYVLHASPFLRITVSQSGNNKAVLPPWQHDTRRMARTILRWSPSPLQSCGSGELSTEPSVGTIVAPRVRARLPGPTAPGAGAASSPPRLRRA